MAVADASPCATGSVMAKRRSGGTCARPDRLRRIAFEHARQRHRRVCLIDGSAEVDTVHRRLSAAQRICAARGIRLTVLQAPVTEEGGWDAAHQMLRGRP